MQNCLAISSIFSPSFLAIESVQKALHFRISEFSFHFLTKFRQEKKACYAFLGNKRGMVYSQVPPNHSFNEVI
jgi:hypothetical protein